MKENWILSEPIPQNKINEISKKLNISQIAAEILIQKGHKTPEKAYKFLNPRIEDLYDPFLMPDMKKAAERIAIAIKSKEKILIYGDYDVDGTTATTLLYQVLKKLGNAPLTYIPHRIREGYGLTQEGVSYCLKSYVNLIITVDCGIGGVEPVRELQKEGIDVIITDHHEAGGELPPAFAILDPKINHYPFDGLSGSGVAFKLAQAIYEELNLEKKELLSYLDLVALATVCDITPIIEENRIITKYGMKILENTQNVGLQALLESTGLKRQAINTYHISFVFGPRMNAPGRLGEAKEIINLLSTEDRGEALRIAQRLKEENSKRQSIQAKIVKEAKKRVKEINIEEQKSIVLAEEKWHPGVIGIAASKLIEEFHCPTILIALDKNIGKGSARSIPEFHLHNALSQCKELLLSFGGHRLAAGLIIESKNINAFKNKFQEIAKVKLKSEKLMPKFFINKDIPLEKTNEKLLAEIEQFAPFGTGNPNPLFLTKGLQIVGYPKIIGKRHIKFKVREDKNLIIDAIGFNLGNTSLSMMDNINLVYTLDKEEWLGKTKLVLKVKDIEKY